MSAGTPADDAERRYQALAEELSVSSGVSPGQMFGMPALKAGSKAFAGRFQDAMVFRERPRARQEARKSSISGSRATQEIL